MPPVYPMARPIRRMLKPGKDSHASVCLECHANLPTANTSGTIGVVPPAFHDLRTPAVPETARCAIRRFTEVTWIGICTGNDRIAALLSAP